MASLLKPQAKFICSYSVLLPYMLSVRDFRNTRFFLIQRLLNVERNSDPITHYWILQSNQLRLELLGLNSLHSALDNVQLPNTTFLCSHILYYFFSYSLFVVSHHLPVIVSLSSRAFSLSTVNKFPFTSHLFPVCFLKSFPILTLLVSLLLGQLVLF